MHDTVPFYKEIHHICFYEIDQINQEIDKINFRSQAKTETNVMISSQTKLPTDFTTAIGYSLTVMFCVAGSCHSVRRQVCV
jgi:hypothetical protein